MRLSNKVLFILGIVWFTFLAFAYLGAHEYLMRSYIKLENEQIKKNILRLNKAIDVISNSVATFTADYAHWNEAYEFIEGNNPQFVPNNFEVTAFVNSKINLIMYFNLNGELKVGSVFDLQQKKILPYPPGLEKYIHPESKLVKLAGLNQDVHGLIALPSGIIFIAASGLSNTAKEKPMNGTLIAGRFFNQRLLQQLANATELNLSFYFLPEITKNLSLKEIFDSATQSESDSYISFVNKNTSYAYSLLRDINDEPIGMIRITSSRNTYQMGSTTITYYLYSFLILGLILSGLIWYLLRKLVLNRLELLHDKIRDIDAQHDYSRRIEMKENDEIASVARQFNRMMETIQKSHQQLELQIHELSISEKNLASTNKKLSSEINERKQAEEKIATLHSQLLLAARRAGMADIASGILHNVGNILNSFVTSISMIKERIINSKAPQLTTLVELVDKNQDHLGEFIEKDPKGQYIPKYLTALSQVWSGDNEAVLQEVSRLERSIGHLNDVIRMQQSLSSVIGLTEEVNPVDLIEDALILCKNRYEIAKIEIVRDYQFNETIMIDKVKLLHIIVNLIKNSIDSLAESQIPHKKITIHLKKMDNAYFTIEIVDNGMGITAENLAKIFSYGFTTKRKDGHGFGLHTSASSAQEMGGILHADSDGLGQGATFTLTIPTSPLKKREKIYLKPYSLDKHKEQ